MTTSPARPSQPSKTKGPGEPADSGAPRPEELRPEGARPARRRRAIDPASAQALAMLTRLPIFAAPIPRVHAGPRGADGSILVDDRVSDRRFLVYTPRRDSQFRAGYRAGMWYVRTPGDADPSPRSPGFPTGAAAIDNLRSSRGPTPQPPSQLPAHRVIWS
jgi:hypothetical protein